MSLFTGSCRGEKRDPASAGPTVGVCFLEMSSGWLSLFPKTAVQWPADVDCETDFPKKRGMNS